MDSESERVRESGGGTEKLKRNKSIRRSLLDEKACFLFISSSFLYRSPQPHHACEPCQAMPDPYNSSNQGRAKSDSVYNIHEEASG